MQPLLQSSIEVAVWVTLYVVWIVACLASNGVLIVRVIQQKRRRPCIDSTALILSLVVSRMLVGVFVLPANVAGLFSAAYGNSLLCKLFHYVSLLLSVACSANLIALIVVTRKEAIGGRLSRCGTGMIVGAVWLVSLLYAARAYVYYDVIRTDRVVSCTVQSRYEEIDNAFSAVDAGVVILAPSCVYFWIYVVVAKATSNNRHKVGATGIAADSPDTGPREQPLEQEALTHANGCIPHDAGHTVASADNRDAGESNGTGVARTAIVRNVAVDSQDPPDAGHMGDAAEATDRGDNTDASDSINVGDASYATLPDESGDVSDTYQAENTATVLHRVDDNHATHVSVSNAAIDGIHTNDVRDANDSTTASETSAAINARGSANSASPRNRNGATGASDDLTNKLHLLIALVTCFMFTTSVSYVWQVVRYFIDSNVVRDNYRHIDRAVYLVTYSNPWLSALILLYYYRSVFRVNSTVPQTT